MAWSGAYRYRGKEGAHPPMPLPATGAKAWAKGFTRLRFADHAIAHQPLITGGQALAGVLPQ